MDGRSAKRAGRSINYTPNSQVFVKRARLQDKYIPLYRFYSEPCCSGDLNADPLTVGPRFHQGGFRAMELTPTRTNFGGRTERKGTVMDHVAILVIWFSSVIAGMLLTMLLPRIFPEPHGNGVYQGEVAQVPSKEMTHLEVSQGRRASMVLVEEKA